MTEEKKHHSHSYMLCKCGRVKKRKSTRKGIIFFRGKYWIARHPRTFVYLGCFKTKTEAIACQQEAS